MTWCCRSLSNIWVYTAATPHVTVANLTTAILQQSPLQLAASSALSIISTFCLHNGTTLQVSYCNHLHTGAINQLYRPGMHTNRRQSRMLPKQSLRCHACVCVQNHATACVHSTCCTNRILQNSDQILSSRCCMLPCNVCYLTA